MHPVTKFGHKRKLAIVEYLGNHCVICNDVENLDIDHINPDTKSFELSGNYLNRTWEYLLPEINKCQLLCKIHHLEKTVKELQGRIPWNKGMHSLSNDSHGNWRSYDIHKCKCTLCIEWKRLYRNKIVDANGNLRCVP